MAVTLKKRSTVGSGLLGTPAEENPVQADSGQEQQTVPSPGRQPEKPTAPEPVTEASDAPAQVAPEPVPPTPQPVTEASDAPAQVAPEPVPPTPQPVTRASRAPAQVAPEPVPPTPQPVTKGRSGGNQREPVPSAPAAPQLAGTRPTRSAASQGAKAGLETQIPIRDQLWAQVQEASLNANYNPDAWSTYSPNLPQDLYDATMDWAKQVSLGARRQGRRPVRANHCLAIAFSEFLPRAPGGDIDPVEATEIGRIWLAEHPKSTVARRKSTGSRLPAELTEELLDLGEHFRSGRIPLWAVFAWAVSQFLEIMNGEQGKQEAAT
jgi:hypothetical protein